MPEVLCIGAATWETQLFGIQNNLMTIDSQQASGSLTCSGGDAVNVSVSLTRLGIDTAILACIGDDRAGENLICSLQEEGVDTSRVIQKAEWHTSAPVLLVGTDGERHIIRMQDSANGHLERSMIPDELIRQCRHLHIASANLFPLLDGKPMGQLLAYARSVGVTTSMDASYDKNGTWERTLMDVVPYLDIFIPSMQEAEMYAGTNQLPKIRDFFSGFDLKVFGVKCGAEGVYVTDFAEEYMTSSLFRGTPNDTTGAGDAFFAGFLAGYLRGYDIRSCSLIGSAQSASVIAGAGANLTAGTWDDAMKKINDENEPLRFR